MIKIHNEVKIIGITGLSGSGKSTVCEYLKNQYHGYVISADKIAHKITSPGNRAYNDLVQNFGIDILKEDSLEIDRKKFGNMVFRDKDKVKKLNNITHPEIVKKIIEQIKLFYFERKNYAFVVLDVPLLIEVGLDKICDQVWLVKMDENSRINNLVKRDELTQSEIKRRFEYQISHETAEKVADRVIENDSDLEQLKAKIKAILDNDN